MKTSSEIKDFIVRCISSQRFLGLYFEIFDELKDTKSPREMKALSYRWAAACNDVRKELNCDMIDDTFFRSIVCYNTVQNFRDMNFKEIVKRQWKDETGWDAEAITNGKHCELAQIIIDKLDYYRKFQGTEEVN